MAQFPAPQNFEFSFIYYGNGEPGSCNGAPLVTSCYCSTFSWDAPNLTGTTATLDHYNIYYRESGSETENVINSTSELSSEFGIGIMGDVWVTAVYTNPEGESEPSNVVTNENLPISVKENYVNEKVSIFYNQKMGQLNISSNESISKINVFNNQGKLVMSTKYTASKINFCEISNGLYIVEVHFNNNETVHKKIIK